ncbi:unnamed protein product [Ilex paraguariensis]|uniref:DNA-directed RNA polymerase III subunit RPC4 n=1 Tax=Ilex paraguariensis TaxID=185542 RepID=A0ABC8QQZ1_9AQUA
MIYYLQLVFLHQLSMFFKHIVSLSISVFSEDHPCYYISGSCLVFKLVASVHVVFGPSVASSTSIRTYGKPREGNADKSSDSGLKDSAPEQNLISWPSTARTDGTSESFVKTARASSDKKKKKKHREPWDYHHSYYPTTLPLRRPYSGDPELLDEAEFGKAAANYEYDESTVHSASELGLLEDNEDTQMLFLQLPPNLPSVKRAASGHGKERAEGLKLSGSERVSPSAKGKEIAESSVSLGGTVGSARAKGKEIAGSIISSRDSGASAYTKGKEIVGNSISTGNESASSKGCSLEELPGGYMGKMLVYKSGAIKFKLGETLYDVSPGSDCMFAQDVVAINTVDKHCCLLGELGKRAVLTPDIDSILDPMV